MVLDTGLLTSLGSKYDLASMFSKWMYLSGCSCFSFNMGSVWRRRERAAPNSRSSINSSTIWEQVNNHISVYCYFRKHRFSTRWIPLSTGLSQNLGYKLADKFFICLHRGMPTSFNWLQKQRRYNSVLPSILKGQWPLPLQYWFNFDVGLGWS